MTRPTFKRQVFAPPPFTVAAVFDPHLRQTQRPEHWATLASWLRESPAIACIVGGDLNRDDFLSFATQQNLSMPILPVPGNWDTNEEPPAPGPYSADPFSDLRGFYPERFGNRDWYHYDVEGRLRILVCQNNSPHVFEGTDWYGNCNPQSPLDHSGWTDPASEQRAWLNARCEEWRGEHVILAAHRPAWAPHHNDIRPLHPCTDAWRIPVQASAGKTFLALGGDIHVGSHCKVNAFGCAFDSITGCGGYVNREVVDGVIPYEWASGLDSPNTYKVHLFFVEYFATWATLRAVEISDDVPEGAIVYEARINPGGAE